MQRFRFTIRRMLFVVAIAAVLSYMALSMGSILWSVFHTPTDLELARSQRLSAERWHRLARENPRLAREYEKIAKRATRAAERLELRARQNGISK